MFVLRLAMASPMLLIAACGSTEPADPGGITPSEAQELNEAAAMLDANAVDANAFALPPGER